MFQSNPNRPGFYLPAQLNQNDPKLQEFMNQMAEFHQIIKSFIDTKDTFRLIKELIEFPGYKNCKNLHSILPKWENALKEAIKDQDERLKEFLNFNFIFKFEQKGGTSYI